MSNYRSMSPNRNRAGFQLRLGLLIAALGAAVAAPMSGAVPAVPAEATATPETLGEYQARELPREWRWAGKATVDFDHMYRQQTSQRTDWIRSGHAR